MTPQSDATAVEAFLARASRRTTLLLVMHGVVSGLVGAIIISVVMWLRHGVFYPPGIESAVLVLFGAAAGFARGWMLRRRMAAVVEEKAPECRNLLVTADELIRGKTSAGTYVSELVYRDAGALARSLPFNTLFPLRGAVTSVTLAAALWLFAATRPAATTVAELAGIAGHTDGTAITGVDANVVLPAYVGQTGPVLHDPSRVEAFVGSRIHLTVRANAKDVSIETLEGIRQLTPSTAGMFTGDVAADADGFIAIEPKGADGVAGARRLIGLTVIADQPPRVQITTPAKDLKFADGNHTLDIAIESDDDLGLASLRLHYTRVSGSGERFTFTEGDVPLTITRTDKRNWKARVSWRLDSLKLDAGDMVVYRAIATDFRPGAAPSESDSYIAEVTAPGGVAAAGFALDPEIERYALSEQMVILKTERLATRKASMAADSFADAAADIASEQRRVRAEFVFMMGGEVGAADDAGGDLNEVAETSGEGDLAAGRMLNQGRIALMSAIRSMSRADKALTALDLTLALTHEHAALTQLELTFAHNRIILRALTERERLDLTRRLSGTLTDAAGDVEPAVRPSENQMLLGLRLALSGISGFTYTSDSMKANAMQATRIAERLLRLDPSSKPGQLAAAQLDSAARAMRDSRRDAARTFVDHAASTVSSMLRAGLYNAPGAVPDGGTKRLAGALTDALRRHP